MGQHIPLPFSRIGNWHIKFLRALLIEQVSFVTGLLGLRFNKYDIPTSININKNLFNDQNQKAYTLDRSATIEIPVISRKVCGDTLVTLLKTLLK